jgi:hypothetical protein
MPELMKERSHFIEGKQTGVIWCWWRIIAGHGDMRALACAIRLEALTVKARRPRPRPLFVSREQIYIE